MHHPSTVANPQARVAAALGTTQSSVSEKLAVFRLHAKVVAALRAGKIDVGRRSR